MGNVPTKTNCFEYQPPSDSERSMVKSAIDLTKEIIEFVTNLASSRIFAATGDKAFATAFGAFMKTCIEKEKRDIESGRKVVERPDKK